MKIKARRILIASLLIFIFFFAVRIFAAPLILSLAKKQIKDVFVGSQVLLQGCAFDPFNRISLYGIDIHRPGLYGIKIGELKLLYSWLTLLKRTISQVYLKDIIVNVNLPQLDLSALPRYLHLKPAGAFLLETLELANCNLNLKIKDLAFAARISAAVKVKEQLLDRLDLALDKLETGDLYLAGLSLKVAQLSPGRFALAQVKYRKLIIEQLRGEVGLGGEKLNAVFSAPLLKGYILTEIETVLDRDCAYRAELKVFDADIALGLEALELAGKFQMSGSLSGGVTLTGSGLQISVLNGELLLPEPGGTLTIRDRQFLEGLVQSTQQPLEVLVESFQDYRYNIGKVFLTLEEGRLLFNLALEGQAGKRNFTVTVHDFNPWKGGRLR